MVAIKVEIISDPICSWCFIAHRTIEKAISLYQKTIPNGSADSFDIIYHPYYLLGPDFPTIEKQAFLDQFRSPSDQQRAYTRITTVGQPLGISFNFFNGKIGGTREAHRLIQLGQSTQPKEVSDGIINGVFSAYHEKALDITDWKVLEKIAVDAGVEKKQVDEWEKNDIGANELDVKLESAKRMAGPHSRGVPIIFVQGKHRIDGAPDVSELLAAFVSAKDGSGEVQNVFTSDGC